MARFPKANSAREQSQGTKLIAEQIAIMEITVAEAISAGVFTASVTNTSTVTIQGTTITGSPMTDNDTDGLNYYKAWKGTITDSVRTEQMKEVIHSALNTFDMMEFILCRLSDIISSLNKKL